MKPIVVALLMVLALPVWAADSPLTDSADIAAKSAQMEVMRVRMAANPSTTSMATLIESENLLRQLRNAPVEKRDALRAQLDAALARLELEIDAAGQGRR